MAEFIKTTHTEEEIDPQMPTDEQIKALHKKKLPIFSSHKEKKFFDSADYFMEQEHEKKEHVTDQIDKIDDHEQKLPHMNAEEISHLPKMYEPEVLKDNEELIKQTKGQNGGEKLHGKKSRFAAIN